MAFLTTDLEAERKTSETLRPTTGDTGYADDDTDVNFLAARTTSDAYDRLIEEVTADSPELSDEIDAALQIKPKNIGPKVVPSTTEIQQQIFPYDTPTISIFTPDTEGGPQPHAGASLRDTFNLSVVIYTSGYDVNETEKRAKIIGRAVIVLMLQCDYETPINAWRNGEIVFDRLNTDSAPIASTRFVTRSAIQFNLEKEQPIPDLSFTTL